MPIYDTTHQNTLNPFAGFSAAHSLVSDAPSINLQNVCISQLLGRDYVFLDHQKVKSLLSNPTNFYSALESLVADLELSEAHTLIVSVDDNGEDDVTFTRHDLIWYKHKICRTENFTISNAEQFDFMHMIWMCSTPAAIV